MTSLGARAASVMELPWSSSNSPSGTVNCRLASPRGPAYTSATSLPAALFVKSQASARKLYSLKFALSVMYLVIDALAVLHLMCQAQSALYWCKTLSEWLKVDTMTWASTE